MYMRAFAAVLFFSLPSLGGAQSITWSECDLGGRARCGTLAVPETRDAPGGRSIEVTFAVFPATDRATDDAPLLVLLGGPGGAASSNFRGIAEAHAAINRSRDLVLVDQRGTGRSAPLSCVFGDDADLQTYLDAFLSVSAMRECTARLGAAADLARYRTRDFVADLETLRGALGLPRWNLLGTSYGTRVALHYMHRHPDRVRSAVLVGVVPPELAMPMTLGADADAALEKLARDCRADSGCAAAFPRLREEVDSIVRRLEREPATVELEHPGTGEPIAVTLTRGTFGETVRTVMYSPRGASTLPLAIHDAYQGDYLPMVVEALTNRRSLARSGAAGLYLAVTCAEDVARVPPEAAYALNRATTMGDARARQHVAACENWPVRPDGDEWPAAAPVQVPVLALVGEADPATPPYWAELAMRTLENARLLIVPQGGHSLSGMMGGECIARLQAAFVDDPDPAGLDAECVRAMRRPPFVLER